LRFGGWLAGGRHWHFGIGWFLVANEVTLVASALIGLWLIVSPGVFGTTELAADTRLGQRRHASARRATRDAMSS
jgi:thiosulfate reductase cytochrome b subunit